MTLRLEDLTMFRASIASYLRERYDDAERRRIVHSSPGWSRDHWQAFAHELGLLGIGFAEQVGGLGGGAAEHALIMEQFGTALVAEPYLATAVIGGGFLKYGSLVDADAIIARLIAGEVIIAFAHGEPGTRFNAAHVATRAHKVGGDFVIDGRKAVVLGAPAATHFVVVARTGGADDRAATGISLFFIDATTPGIERRDYATISGGIASEIQFASVRVPAAALMTAEGEALPLIEQVIDEATAVLCAEANGVMTRLHGDTLAYVRQRQQFGKPLASFQVLQHRLVDMLIAMAHSSAITDRAIAALAAGPAERARMVSAAKVFIGKSARFVGQNAIQLHGGAGMTDDLAVGFFFKRATEIERQFGTIEHHLTRYERLAFADAQTA